MSGIFIGNATKIFYNTDAGNNIPNAPTYVNIDELAAFPEVKIQSSMNEYETYNDEYSGILASNKIIQSVNIVVNYVPGNVTHVFLDSMFNSQTQFQIKVSLYESLTSVIQHYAILSGYVSTATLSGDQNSVVKKTYVFTAEDVIARGTITDMADLKLGDYGVGANGVDIPQYESLTPSGNSFLKVPASQAQNPTGTDLLGIANVDNGNTTKLVMTESGTFSIYGKNQSSSWTQILTKPQSDSAYVPMARTVNGKALSSNITLTPADVSALALTGGTLTGNLNGTTATFSGAVSTGNLTAGTISGTTGTFTGAVQGPSAAITGAVSADTITLQTKATTKDLAVTGDIQAVTATLTGALTGVSASLTGALNAGTTTLSGALTGTTATFSGSLAASTLSLTTPLSTANGGTGNANGTVSRLTTPRSFQTNLGSTTAITFDGTANVSPGVTGILPIANGGTGASTVNGALTSLNAVSKSGDVMSGDLIVNDANGTSTIRPGAIEIYAPTPFIDFHYSNSTTDYDTRIINDASGRITFTSFTTSNGFASVKGGSFRARGGVIGVATTDESVVFDFSISSGNLLLARSNTGSVNWNGAPHINAGAISSTGNVSTSTYFRASQGLSAIGTGMNINQQGTHILWNENQADGRGSIVVNRGAGTGGFDIRLVNADNTVQTAAYNFDSNGIFASPNGSYSVNKRVRAFTGVQSNYLELQVDGATKGMNFFDSDLTLKEKILDADEERSIDIIRGLRPVSYKFKDTHYTYQEPDQYGDYTVKEGVSVGASYEYGVIAQEFEEIMPCGVITNSTGKKSLDPLANIGLLLAVCHKQQQMIDELQSKVDELESKFNK
ncbi:tail fiber domain-containing protein [Pantoea agglomerans]|uniref:tail fiber domain-containing protein n=1 Tax=Enterobacter agglomerans TaxID=549 RepID=UPI00289B6B81|nr:tail fiber domain-containing protein [Pantoea agglomerans]WNK56723.1 tail fiber domain-containing protein [Pantoea agglomerans]